MKAIDREILRLAVPAFLALVAEPLFLLSDAAIVGHLGTPELAGLGVAAVVLQTVIGLCVFLAYGTTASVARHLGAGDLRAALAKWDRREIGPIATPDVIQFAPALPKTRSGKIMRRILRKIAENETGALGDISTLADPSVVEKLVADRFVGDAVAA